MKKTFKIGIHLFIIGVSFILVATSCNKDEIENTTTVTDIDGNIYNTITIGTQEWMKENLKVTKLNDGTPIELVTDNIEWGDITTPGYCWYDNDINNKDIYGGLYNYYTVITSKLCPDGWHVPSDAEWTTLTDFLGGENIAGGKMKETGNTHWLSPNAGATNESGFTGLPGGYRHRGSSSIQKGEFAYFWSSTEHSNNEYWLRGLSSNDAEVDRYTNQLWNGLSVRCIKD